MEGLIVLICLFVFGAPIVTFIMALVANSRCRKMEDRVKELEQQLKQLEKAPSGKASAPQSAPVVDKAAVEPKAPVVVMEKQVATSPVAEVVQPVTPPPVAQPAQAKPVPAKPPVAPQPVKQPAVAQSRVPNEAPPNPFAELTKRLRAWGMWPPVDEGQGAEVILMRWWLPRIGGALAVLSLLFLGIYVSQFTTPAMKALELVVTSFGVCGLGLFAERRNKGFGGVLFVTGLVMLYLTSYAVYALPAVRIITNPLAGSLLQLAALGIIAGAGLWRRDSKLVHLANGFGLLLVLFMAWEGLNNGVLLTSVLLLLSSALLWGWKPQFSLLPYMMSVTGGLCSLCFVLAWWHHGSGMPDNLYMTAYLGVALILQPLCLWGFPHRKVDYERWFAILNISFTTGAGYFYFHVAHPEALTVFYGVIAVLSGVLAVLYYIRRGFHFHVNLYLTYGSFFLASWLVHYFQGDLRWLCLGLQALALGALARRSRSLTNEIVMLATWVISIGYYLDGPGLILDPIWQADHLIPTLYGVVLLAALSWMWGRREALGVYWKLAVQTVLSLVAAVIIAKHSDYVYFTYFESQLCLYIAIAVGLLVLLPRFNPVPWAVVSVFFFLRGACLFTEESNVYVSPVLIWAWVLVAFAALQRKSFSERLWFKLVELFFFAVATVCLSCLQRDLLEGTSFTLIGAILLGIAFLALSRVPLLRSLSLAGVFPLLGVLVTETQPESFAWHWAALLLAYVWVLAYACPKFQSGVKAYITVSYALWSVAPAALMAFLLWLTPVVPSVWLWHELLLMASLVGCLYAVQRLRIYGLLLYGGALLLSLAGSILSHVVDYSLSHSPYAGHFLLMGVATFFLILGIGLWFNRQGKNWLQNGEVLVVLFGLLAYAVGVATVMYPPLNWNNYYTPFFSLVSVLFVICGMRFYLSSYRIIGLVTLILPGIRLFVYDVTSPFYRILAFGIGSVFLIFIGYLYHRWSNSMKQKEAPGKDTAEEKPPSA